MRLVLATEEFRINGQSYPGFPLIVDREMRSVEPARDFLIHECLHRGRVRSRKSWAAYGQAMYDYFGFLEARELDWRDGQYDENHSIVAAYRDWSVETIGLSGGTVNYRLRIIIRFYRYAHEQGWIDQVPFDIEEVIVGRPKGFLAHIDKSGGVRRSPDVLLAEKKPVIKVLTREEIRKLLEGTKHNVTIHNIIRMGLQTGLRKAELLTFPRKYVTNPAHDNTHRSMIRVNCDPRDTELKGNKPRSIDVPRALMERLWDYCLHERHQRLVDNDVKEDPGTLFVNQRGCTFSIGASSIAELMQKVLGFSYPHMLRHAYATHTLHELRKRGSTVDPLMYVRDRLGHSSITTTERYLHYLSMVEDDVITAYQEELDSI